MTASQITLPGRKNKILIIDDEADNLYVLKERLEHEGFEVLLAENGSQGISKAMKELPAVILCDIMMPELNGYDVMKVLRKNALTDTIPFIFLTAKSELKDMREGMEIGADDYITKPFNNKTLVQSIYTRLEKKKIHENKLEQLRSSISLSLPHELQTPLTTILGFNEILQEDYNTLKPEEILNISQHISLSAQRLNDLVQRVLLATKLEIISKDETQVSALRASSLPSPRYVIEVVSNKIALKYKRISDIILNAENAFVSINEQNLERIIEELVDNAFKYSHKGNHVMVESSISKSGFNICVTDYGRGMNENEIANLGDFMQFDRMLFERKGTGLGLSIVKKIVDIHGGKMQINSIPSEQTQIKVTLPF